MHGLTMTSAVVGTKMTTRATSASSRVSRGALTIVNSGAGPKRGVKAAPAQRAAGYKGSTESGSAPKTRSGKAGYVYKLGLKNGKANVDEYSPIWTPQDFKSDGDKYEGNLLYWAVTLAGILGTGVLAIVLTSAL